MRAPPESLSPMIGAADPHGLIHDLADLLRVGFAERAADDREVLAEDEDLAAVDRAVAGDDAVAGVAALLAGVVAAADLQDVELLEGALVQQKIDALAGCELAAAVLVVDPRGAAGLKGLVLHGLEIREVALEPPACRRTGLRLLQPLRQLRFALQSVLVFHSRSSIWAII